MLPEEKPKKIQSLIEEKTERQIGLGKTLVISYFHYSVYA